MFKYQNLSFLALVAVLLWSAFTPVSESAYTGKVITKDGQPLVYAEVYNKANELLTWTDLEGHFRLVASPTDNWVQVRYPGFTPQEATLEPGKSFDFVLSERPLLTTGNAAYAEKPVRMEYSEGDYEIKGKVVDEATNEALIGASILLVGTTKGTVTDIDGSFTLKTMSERADLQISYTGYDTQVLNNVPAGVELTVRMNAGATLDDLEVVALGESRKTAFLSMDRSPARAAEYAPSAVESAAPTSLGYATPTDGAVISHVWEESPKGAPAHHGGERPDAGQLTAGEINDFSKWDMWSDISQEDLGQYRSTWKQFADHRHTLQLRNERGMPAVNVPVQLEDGQGNILWRARTDALGRAELWAHYFREARTAANGLKIVGREDGHSFSMAAKPFAEGLNTHTIRQNCRESAQVDVAFVVDATGSMGDEIQYLQSELLDVIQRVKEELPEVDLQTGSVFYRDHAEEYLTRNSAFSKDTKTTHDFIAQQYASGGGDYPEAVESALEEAVNTLEWRTSASTRLLFLVLDAPPHQAEENIKRLQVAVTKAAEQGIQIIPVSCSGVDKSTEYLLRAMALATNGTYTFVTDHSGIGNAHIEPSTDSYEVEFLNDVLVRLTVSRSRLVSCDRPIAVDEQLPSPFLKSPATGERNWTFFPNPSTGPVSLSLEESEQPGDFYLFDTQGKLLEQFKVQDRTERNWSYLASGTYWIRHQNTEGVWTQGQLVLAAR